MKIAFGSRRRHYLISISVFLIVVALIAGMVGCVLTKYDLTISSTEGGEVTTPGEGAFAYDEGTIVDLVSEAYDGYQFINWSGDVSAIADVYAASTTITMSGDYSITANFAVPTEIHDWYDLAAIRYNLSGSYILMNDLDSTAAGYEELASPTADGGWGWQPIGSGHAPFTGSFDGQGYEIHDLVINRSGQEYVGLFGVVDEGGYVECIGVVNVDVIGEIMVGGLVGVNVGIVSNSYSAGKVTGEDIVGGLLGGSAGNVSNSYSISSVSGRQVVGGLLGWNAYGIVSNAYAMGNASGEWGGVGGLVGWNEDGTVSNSYSTTDVTCEGLVGGLMGRNDGTVSNSHYNYDDVLINGENIITVGALFDEDFDEWLANDKSLDVNERLSQEDGYYLLSNVVDFKQLLAFGQDNSLKFRLESDLDLTTEPNFYIPWFTGEFNGNGHRISNLSFNFNFIENVGLFGYVTHDGKVSEVIVENVDITGAGPVGSLVGWNNGEVTEVGVENVEITGDHYAGGLIGRNRGNVSGSNSSGSVTGDWRTGGLMGENQGIVLDSNSAGSVTVGGSVAGGLVGYNRGTAGNCYSTAHVTGEMFVGGLVGENRGDVNESYSTGKVTGDLLVGGLVAHNTGIVSNSYSTGNVTSDGEVGGLVGCNKGTVSSCYSSGLVIDVVSGNETEEHIGGLVGYNFEGIVSNSFWDTETSGQDTSDGGAGKNTTEMKDISTFSGATWGIIEVGGPDERNPAYIWNIVDDVTYPFLSWQP